jgi:hypothetical protein
MMMRIQLMILAVLANSAFHSGDKTTGLLCFGGAAVIFIVTASMDHDIFQLITMQSKLIGEFMGEQGNFVIRMQSGMYFAPTANQPWATTPELENAKHYPTRFAALAEMNRGIQFAGSAIVTVSEAR